MTPPRFTDKDFLYQVADTFLHELWHSLDSCSDLTGLTTGIRMAEPPMDDCPNLLVWLENVFAAPQQGGEPHPGICATQWKATYTARLLRCYITDPDAVDGSDANAFTLALYQDAYCMYLKWLCTVSTYCQDPEHIFHDVVVGPLRPIGETGGSAGWQFSITLDIG